MCATAGLAAASPAAAPEPAEEPTDGEAPPAEGEAVDDPIAILKAEMVVLAESLRVAEEADAAAAKLLEREKAVLSVMREVRVWAGRRGRRGVDLGLSGFTASRSGFLITALGSPAYGGCGLA